MAPHDLFRCSRSSRLRDRFYMGPAFVVRGHNSRECSSDEIPEYVDDLLESYGPGPILDRGICE